MPEINSILVFSLFFVAVGLVIDFIQKRSWRQLARRTGLKFQSGLPFIDHHSVSGIYRGHSIRVNSYDKNRGKTFTHLGRRRRTDLYTRIVLKLVHPSTVILSLFPAGTKTPGNVLRNSRIFLGDSELDQQLEMYGYPQDQATQMLNHPNVFSHLLTNRNVSIEITQTSIYCEKPGIEDDIDVLIAQFDLVSALADVIDAVSYPQANA